MTPPVALIATALPEEYDAVREHLQSLSRLELGPDTYEVGSLAVGSHNHEVAIAQYGMYNLNAAAKTRAFLAGLRPRYACFSGIGGGLKDLDVGDVLIGTVVHAAAMGKEDVSGFHPRGEAFRTSYFLQECARSVAQDGDWLRALPSTYRPAKALLGAIASTEAVLNHSAGPLRTLLSEHYSDAKVVEMEGAGFLAACQAYESSTLPIVVRGISDLARFKELSEGEGSQPRAAAAAAAFSLALLRRALSLTARPEIGASISVLTEIMPSLYSEGPRDREIWRRAGGDVSRLPISPDARTAWYRALQELGKGIGGIDLARLVDAALTDYPNHVDLQSLKRARHIV